MSFPRISIALDDGALRLPEEGRIVVTDPGKDVDLSVLPQERVDIVEPRQPDHNSLTARGYRVSPQLGGTGYAAALICLPRARQAAQFRIAETVSRVRPGGLVLVDGQKTDGIDTFLKAFRARLPVSEPVVKAHGKLFWFGAAPAFDDWLAIGRNWTVIDGFRTGPGLFSADAVDPGSAALVAALPKSISGHVVDLGAGWGYLSRHILAHPEVTSLDMVEADHNALEAARRNVTDPRASFHWADATTWQSGKPVNLVVMNPPFHHGRAADPALGRAFIATAARILSPKGTLWLVANRHLPYESALAEMFRDVQEVAGTSAFKVVCATRPKRPV